MADETEVKRRRARAMQLRLQLNLRLGAEGGGDQPKEPAQPEVVATTDYGGRVLRMGDGSLAFRSPGYSTSDPAKVERLMQGATPADIVRDSFDEQVLSQRGGLVSAGAKFVQGIPFAGEWIDEGLNALSPGVGDNLRQTQAAMDRQRPGRAMTAQIAGGVAGSIPAVVGIAGKAMQAPSVGGRIVRGAAMGGAAGAAEGAVSGAGRAEPGARAQGATEGGAIGLGLGAALGALMPAAGAGVTELARRVKRLDVRTIADELGVSMPAARMVKSAIQGDDLDEAARIIQRGGDDAMLADAGPATGQLLDAAQQTGGQALRTSSRAVSERAQQAGGRLTSTLDRVLGPADGMTEAARAVSRRTASARQAAYSRAYQSPIDYAGPGRNIEAVLQRVPSGTMQRAIAEANEAMQEAGTRNLQIMAKIGDDGSVTFVEMPNVQQLDEIKKALGGVAREAVDDFGRPTAAGLRASRLARDLGDAIGEAAPAYKQAVRLGGDKIAEDQALRMGNRLLRRDTTFQEVREAMQGASAEAKAAAKRGLREHIDTTMSNVRRTITDPNTDAREAMQLVREMSSRANIKKARLVLGTDAKALFDELERAEAALALRAATTRNSATAARLAVQGQARDELQPGVLRQIAGRAGNPLDAARSVTEVIAGIDPRTMSQAEQAMFAEIAEALTKTRGADAARAVQVIKAAMAGQPIRDAEAALIGRVVAGTLGTGSYQLGTQALSRPPQR